MKPTLTVKRHKQIGRMLFPMRNKLVSLCVEVSNSRSGKRQRRAAAALNKACDNLDRARSELEEVLFDSHPDQADIKVYYPGPRGFDRRKKKGRSGAD